MVKVHIYPRQTHHIGRNIIPSKVFRQTLSVIGGQCAFAILILVLCKNVTIGTDQKTGCTAGRVQNSLVFLRVYDFHHHINDMAGGTKLAGISLAAHNGQEIFKGITQVLAVVIREVADFFEEHIQGVRVPIRDICSTENIPEQLRKVGVRSHFFNAFRIEKSPLLPAVFGLHDFRPGILLILTCKKLPGAAKFQTFYIHVIHEFINERNGNLFNLCLGIGHLAHQNITQRIDLALYVKCQHFLSSYIKRDTLTLSAT